MRSPAYGERNGRNRTGRSKLGFRQQRLVDQRLLPVIQTLCLEVHNFGMRSTCQADWYSHRADPYRAPASPASVESEGELGATG